MLRPNLAADHPVEWDLFSPGIPALA